MNDPISLQTVPVVPQADDQRRRSLPALPGQEGPAFLWVRFRCGCHVKASQDNATRLLNEAMTMKCVHCRTDF